MSPFQKLVLGPSTLLVKDLTQMVRFYRDLVGLSVLKQTTESIMLGFDQTEILELVAAPDHDPAQLHAPGLYHHAILFESRATLAQTLITLFKDPSTNYVGSADHLVSEAFYFEDPERNGVELYFDRDPKTWSWQNGLVTMGSKYLDPRSYIEQYIGETGVPAKKLGHIHLKVSRLHEARNFYVETLGLHLTGEFPGALFVSDGTYHHHFGLNTWESQGQMIQKHRLGLRECTMTVSGTDLQQIQKRLAGSAYQHTNTHRSTVVIDPNDLKITIMVE